MQTEELIARLSRDLRPVRRVPGPWTLTLRWLAIAGAVIALATAAIACVTTWRRACPTAMICGK